jgi:DNA-binding XRE family transcriptional regulator
MLLDTCHKKFDDHQTAMARSIRIPQPTLSKIMSGDTETPSRKTATRIASYLGISVDAVYDDAPASPPHSPRNQ